MKYKGYTGVVEFDEEAGTLFGRVIGLRDLITFEGESVAEVTQAFYDSVDVYLELCAERGESPEKPYSGQFVLRIDPQLHRELSRVAEERRVSLNSLVEEHLRTAVVFPGEIASAVAVRSPRVAAAQAAPRRAGKGGIVLEPGSSGSVIKTSHRGKERLGHQKATTPKSSKGSPAGKHGKG